MGHAILMVILTTAHVQVSFEVVTVKYHFHVGVILVRTKAPVSLMVAVINAIALQNFLVVTAKSNLSVSQIPVKIVASVS